MSHSSFLHLNETAITQSNEYEAMNNSTNAGGRPEIECFYEATRLERSRYGEEGFYDFEVFTHYLSGFCGLSLAIIGLVVNSFCAFTLCRAAVFRSHLIFLCAISIANALQLSCLIIIITREIRQPDPNYINLLPRVYIQTFLYLYPLSKFFHLTMGWFVTAAGVDCWRWMRKARRDEARFKPAPRSKSITQLSVAHFRLTDSEPTRTKRPKCKSIVSQISVLVTIALLALVYTIPTAWENKGDILFLGKMGNDNCTAYIYHMLQTTLSNTELYRIGYSLLGHLMFQTGIPLVLSSIAIAKISRQLQITSSSLGLLISDAVQIMLRAGIYDRPNIPGPTHSQRAIVEHRNIIHCSLFLSVFTFYVCHIPQLWAKIQWSLMHMESHQNSHMRYVNEFVNFMTVANAAINGMFIMYFCRRHIAFGARDIDFCAWCFPSNDGTPRRGLCRQRQEMDDGREETAIHSDGEEEQQADSMPADNGISSTPNPCGEQLSRQPPEQPVSASVMRNSTAEGLQYNLTVDPGDVSTDSSTTYNANYQSQSQAQVTRPPPHYKEVPVRSQLHLKSLNSTNNRQYYYQQGGASNFQPNIPQQYFTMGHNNDDIYVAAQV